MYTVDLTDAAVGRKLANNIYDDMGRVLLRRGVELTPGYVRRLRDKGFRSVYALNELAPDVMAEAALSEETRIQAANVMRDFAVRATEGRTVDLGAINETVDGILESLSRRRDAIMNLVTIKTIDNYTFEHCVNVCVLSVMLHRALNGDPSEATRLGEGALLHDVGKVSIPPTILFKPGKLTDEEYETVKRHTVAGHSILSRALHDSPAPEIALSHHERPDGRGYPDGRRLEKIDFFSRIVAVADVYDAVTSDRGYREKLRPDQAVDLLHSVAGSQLDAELVDVLASRIAHYPEGSIVRLSTGELAVVIAQSDRFSPRPIVRKVVDPDGIVADQPEELSLAEEPGVEIEEVLEDYPDTVHEQISS